jgi:hypothetical protein
MSVARKSVEASTKSEAWLEEPGRRLSHKGGQEVVGFYPTLKVRLEQPEISGNKAIKGHCSYDCITAQNVHRDALHFYTPLRRWTSLCLVYYLSSYMLALRPYKVEV